MPREAKVMPAKKQSLPRVYQLKITLKGIRPPIWRRLQVPGATTLAALHQVLQAVFGWTDSHLHQFIVDETYYGEPEHYEDYDDIETVDEKKAILGGVVHREKQRFLYVYDFGDNWEHEIVVEKIIVGNSGSDRPLCLGGKRQGPPEDCGGTMGYQEFLEAIRDPDHEEHEAMLEWVGGSFDPKEFDLATVNPALAWLSLRRSWVQ